MVCTMWLVLMSENLASKWKVKGALYGCVDMWCVFTFPTSSGLSVAILLPKASARIQRWRAAHHNIWYLLCFLSFLFSKLSKILGNLPLGLRNVALDPRPLMRFPKKSSPIVTKDSSELDCYFSSLLPRSTFIVVAMPVQKFSKANVPWMWL